MLEVLNGVLLAYFVILCTVSALVPHLVKPIAACFNKPSNKERDTWSDIKKYKAEQAKLSIKENFAAYSKIQRKIIKLETELKDDSKSRISRSLAVKGSVHVVLQVIVTLMIVISMIWFRREPLVILKGNLFPLSKILQYPSDVPNTISTQVWVVISNISIRSLVKPYTS